MRSFHLELETTGFLPQQINTYISHCIPDLHTISEMQSFMTSKPLIKDLLRIPIQLDAFCYVWALTESLNRKDTNELSGSRRDSISTMTTLYQSISLELCKRDIARLGFIGRPHELMEFEINKVLKIELKLVKELAFQGLINAITEFNPKHQDRIGSFLAHNGVLLPTPYRPMLERTSFLRCSDLEQSQRNYHFIHLTFQEFFAAKHFAEHWQKRTSFVCLQLTTPGTRQEVNPFDFLRKEKYNPQYNIFWRFVTGLIQMQSEEQNQLGHNHNDIIAFFDLLHDKPIDLLRAGQYLLAMHCLSELTDSAKQAVQDLRQRQEHLLRMQVVREYRTTGEWRSIVRSFSENEFPEGALRSFLRSFLQYEYDLPLEKTLNGIVLWRESLEAETLVVVSEFLSNTFSTDIRLSACIIIFEYCTQGQQDILARAIQDYYAMTKDRAWQIRSEAAQALQYDRRAPEEADNAVIALLKDENDSVRFEISIMLGDRLNLSHGNFVSLIGVLQDGDDIVRISALDALDNIGYSCREAGFGFLPEEAVIPIIASLRDKNPEVRRAAVDAFRSIEDPSEEAIIALAALLQDVSHKVREALARTLGIIKPLPKQGIVALTALLQDGNHAVRESAAYAHMNIKPLPDQAVVALTALLQDKNDSVREAAIYAFQVGKLLPEQVVVAMIALLQDKNDSVRGAARRRLSIKERDRPSRKDAVSSLLTRLKCNDSVTGYNAVAALAESNLSKETTILLVSMLNDPEVHHLAACALSGSPLYKDVIPILLSMFDCKNDLLISSAGRVLSRWSLPEHVVTILIEKLKNGDSTMLSAATHALRQQSSLSLEHMAALIATLKHDKTDNVYQVLQRCRVWSLVADLDDQRWQDLYTYWLQNANTDYIETVCYEFENSLWLWESGVQYQLSSDSKRTQELVQLAHSTQTWRRPLLEHIEDEIDHPAKRARY